MQRTWPNCPPACRGLHWATAVNRTAGKSVHFGPLCFRKRHLTVASAFWISVSFASYLARGAPWSVVRGHCLLSDRESSGHPTVFPQKHWGEDSPSSSLLLVPSRSGCSCLSGCLPAFLFLFFSFFYFI